MYSLGEIARLELNQRRLEVAAGARAELEARIETEQALGSLEDPLESPASALPDELYLRPPRAPAPIYRTTEP